MMTPGDVLAVLETLASEHPDTVPPVVAALASSPARSALLELAPLFRARGPAEIAAAAVATARQLDRLEARPRWKAPGDVLGDAAASAATVAPRSTTARSSSARSTSAI